MGVAGRCSVAASSARAAASPHSAPCREGGRGGDEVGHGGQDRAWEGWGGMGGSGHGGQVRAWEGMGGSGQGGRGRREREVC